MKQLVKENVLRYHFNNTNRCFAGCGAIISRECCDIAHIIAESCGGTYTSNNLRVTCKYCNRSGQTENLFDYIIRNNLTPPFSDEKFIIHVYGGDALVEPVKLEKRDIREVVLSRVRDGGPVGIISAATGCGKTSLAMEIVGKFISGRILLWVTEMNVVVKSQFTRRNILGWRDAGIMPDNAVYLFNSHLKYCNEFPSTCIIACTHATARLYHTKVTADPRFVGFVIDECHDEVNGPVTSELFSEIAPRATVRLGLTATPRQKTAAGGLFAAKLDMAAPRYLLEYSIFEALRDGHVRFPECKFARISGPKDATMLAMGDSVSRNIMTIVLESATRKGIIWADNVDSSRDIYNIILPELRAAGVAVYLDNSKMRTDRTEHAGRIFRDATGNCVIVACERYRAGVDVRGLSFGIICGRDCKNITTIIQCLGRLTRLEPFTAVFAELGVTEDAETYRSNLRARLLDYYEHISRHCELELKYNGGKVSLVPRVGDGAAAPPVYFSMLEGVEICELARFTADEMMAELRARLGFLIDDEYLRRVFAAAGLKSAAEIEAFLENGCGGCGELGRWWGIMRYLSSGVNWNRILGVVGDFYPDFAAARQAMNRLVGALTIADVAGKSDSQIYENILRERDKKLPPNPTNVYGLPNLGQLVVINRRKLKN